MFLLKHRGYLSVLHTERGWPSEQRHGAWNRPFQTIHYGYCSSRTRAAVLIRASRQKTRRENFWPFILALCEVAKPSIVVELIIIRVISQLFEVDLVPEKGTDTTESLDELVTFAGSVRDELKSSTKVLV